MAARFVYMMRMLLYNVLLALIAGPSRWWLRRHPKHHPLVERFNPPIPPMTDRPLWIHACSLGEVNTARPLVEALRARHPDAPLLITASTVTGHERATALFPNDAVTWLPFDTAHAVRRFLDAARPRALVLIETELWPNILAGCQRRHIPVVLANGRLSDRHLRRYRRMRWWYRPLLQGLAAAGMQSERYAQRIVALGAAPERVCITGNLKFDAVQDHVPGRSRAQLRSQHGFRPEDRILVFGSTRPGDEALASACWATLREEYPDLRLVVAPRHVDRADEIAGFFSEPLQRRTRIRQGATHVGERVLLVDTMGELAGFLAMASVAVVGGSFFPGVNGHNPLEPAALGVPVVFGHYMSNFEDAAATLVARKGARQVACPEDLYLAISELLGNAAEQRQMGTRARRAVLDNQGAVQATIDLIASVVDAAAAG